MRTGWIAAALLAWACGGGTAGGPSDDGPPQQGINDEIPPRTDLWPLSSGSTWTYRVTGDVERPIPFDKQVHVDGARQVPGTGVSATAVRSVQPHIEELSWQTVVDGKVIRLREEDRKQGLLDRVITWAPSVMLKGLSEAKPVGWSETIEVTENEYDGAGALLDDKPKSFVWTVQAIDQTVATAAGTFTNAIKVQRVRTDKQDDPVRTYWLVPGVGKVREEGERTEDLVRYDVK